MEPVLGEKSSSRNNAAKNGDSLRPVARIRRSARGKKTDGLTEGINVRLIVHCSVVVSPSPPG